MNMFYSKSIISSSKELLLELCNISKISIKEREGLEFTLKTICSEEILDYYSEVGEVCLINGSRKE